MVDPLCNFLFQPTGITKAVVCAVLPVGRKAMKNIIDW